MEKFELLDEPQEDYKTGVFGHLAGNGQWLVYWAIVYSNLESNIKGTKTLYTPMYFKVLCQEKPELLMRTKMFLSEQVGRGITNGQRITKLDHAKSIANRWINKAKESGAQFLFNHEDLEFTKDVDDFLNKYGDI